MALSRNKVMSDRKSSVGVTLVGASNFRNLGGMRSVDGTRIRSNALMRSERLHRLTPEDWEHLRSLGVAVICDLRSDDERDRHPNKMPATVTARVLSLPVPNDVRGDPTFLDKLAKQPDAAGAERLMEGVYRRLPNHALVPLRSLFSVLIDGGMPLLVHCTAGKDRTGFAVAILLHALGIPSTEIYQDYLASSHWPGAAHHRPSMSRWLAPVVSHAQMSAVLDALLTVRSSYLEVAFGTIEADFGSLGDYLKACGLNDSRLRQLREQLTVQGW
jgi:protein-tyrosine phosphatase